MNDKTLKDYLLDSSLISRTNKKKYHIKIVECSDYVYVYKYEFKTKKDKNLERMNKKKIDFDYLFKKENFSKKQELKTIEYKNILRSKFGLQRLVKANEKEFKTFITLTFAENITDLDYANYCFNIFCKQVRRLKPDFKYVCVPEFQRRGAVHYHLLTNLDINNDVNIIIPQKDTNNQYDVRFWKHGFTSVFPLYNINVVGYISKYMTKDIDNRLFGRKRYFYSQNLKRPKEYLIDLDSDDFLIMLELISDKEEVFKNTYLTKSGEAVFFTEYKKI